MPNETKPCDNCGQPVKIVPPGISKKTNKPYGAFYKCAGCGFSKNVGEQPMKPKPAMAQLDRIEQGINEIKQMLMSPEPSGKDNDLPF